MRDIVAGLLASFKDAWQAVDLVWSSIGDGLALIGGAGVHMALGSTFFLWAVLSAFVFKLNRKRRLRDTPNDRREFFLDAFFRSMALGFGIVLILSAWFEAFREVAFSSATYIFLSGGLLAIFSSCSLIQGVSGKRTRRGPGDDDKGDDDKGDDDKEDDDK